MQQLISKTFLPTDPERDNAALDTGKGAEHKQQKQDKNNKEATISSTEQVLIAFLIGIVILYIL